MKIAFLNSQYAHVNSSRPMEWDEIAAMLFNPKISGSKNGTAWMPADIAPGARNRERVQSVSALVLDVEADASKDPATKVKTVIGAEPPPFDELAAEFELSGNRCIMHTSYSHNDLHPRYRIVFDVSRPLAKDEVRPLALHVAALFGLSDCVDTACMDPERLFFLPRCPADRREQFRHEVIEGAPLDVGALLTEIRREAAALVNATAKSNTRGKNTVSAIDAFNATYSPGEILEKNGYVPMRNRWLYPSSTTGMPGVRLLPNSTPERIFSGHSNDPLADGHAHDAFDCYRILECTGDFKSAVREAARMLGMDTRRNDPAGSPSSHSIAAGGTTPLSHDNELPEEPFFMRVSLADVLSNPPEPQRYIWGERIPFDELSLLAAHGGTGKSLFAMQLAGHTATGRPFLGLPTEKIKTLFFSAEDATDTIRRRFAAICRADDLDPAEVAGNLIALDATAAPCLFHDVSMAGVKTAEPTAHYAELKSLIEEAGVGFLIVDNASDSFGANPIDRQAVTKFVRALVRLVRGNGGAVLLLSHVNKVTSRNGAKQADSEGYADSAAWHNAARSRLFLNAIDDAGTLALAHNKNNYGRKQPVLNMAFREDGSSLHLTDAEQIAASASGMAGAAGLIRNMHRAPLLKLIHEFYTRGESISPSPNSHQTNAHTLLKTEVAFPFDKGRTGKSECLACLREFQRDGYLTIESYQTKQRKNHDRWQLTPKGLSFIGEPVLTPSAQAELNADAAKNEEMVYV